MIHLKSKEDCLNIVKSLYGLPSVDKNRANLCWELALEQFGIENLPTGLLLSVAREMLVMEGEDFEIEMTCCPECGSENVKFYVGLENERKIKDWSKCLDCHSAF